MSSICLSIWFKSIISTTIIILESINPLYPEIVLVFHNFLAFIQSF
jgi:hypothetical protein